MGETDEITELVARAPNSRFAQSKQPFLFSIIFSMRWFRAAALLLAAVLTISVEGRHIGRTGARAIFVADITSEIPIVNNMCHGYRMIDSEARCRSWHGMAFVRHNTATDYSTRNVPNASFV